MDIADPLPPAGPSPDMSRVYDYWLGGQRAYKADRVLAERLEQLCDGRPGTPTLRELAARDRAYVLRAVRSAAGAGVRQVIDISAGYPGRYKSPWPGVPMLVPACDAAKGIRAVYVRSSPEAHSVVRGMLAGHPDAAAVPADPCNPEFALEAVAGYLNLAKPVILVASRAFTFLDVDQAADVATGWMAGLAQGSRMVMTLTHCSDPELWRQVRALVPAARNHTAIDMKLWFAAAGTALESGIEVARGWGPEPLEVPVTTSVLAGVGIKA